MRRFGLTLAAAVLGLLSGCGGTRKAPIMATGGEVNAQADAPADVAATDRAAADRAVPDGLQDGREDGLLPADGFRPADSDVEADVTGPQMCPAATDAWLDKLCAVFCGKIEQFHLETSFATADKCPGMCREVLAGHPDWLPNFLCVAAMEQHYFFGNCWWPKPLPPIPGCEGWCGEVLGCGLSGLFHVPPDECLCEAACDGIFAMTGDAAPPLVECATKKLAGSCDIYEMLECFSMPLDCGQTCEDLAAQCKEGLTLAPLFPDGEACIEACQESTQEQLLALQVCIAVDGCAAPKKCAGIPEEPLPGCDQHCEAFQELCPFADIPPYLCPWVCTGAALAVPGPDPEAGAACLAKYETCPQEPAYALVGCLVGKCGLMCGLFDQCKPGSQYLSTFESQPACKEKCDTLTYGQAVATGYCLAWAGCDGAQKCADPPAGIAAGCDTWCDTVLALCPANGIVHQANCLDACTGLTMAIPVATPGSAGKCLDEYKTCPEDPTEAIYGCLVDSGAECVDACADLEKCGLVTAWLCEVLCSILEKDDPAVHAMFIGCVDNASSCAQMKPCVGQ